MPGVSANVTATLIDAFGRVTQIDNTFDFTINETLRTPALAATLSSEAVTRTTRTTGALRSGISQMTASLEAVTRNIPTRSVSWRLLAVGLAFIAVLSIVATIALTREVPGSSVFARHLTSISPVSSPTEPSATATRHPDSNINRCSNHSNSGSGGVRALRGIAVDRELLAAPAPHRVPFRSRWGIREPRHSPGRLTPSSRSADNPGRHFRRIRGR